MLQDLVVLDLGTGMAPALAAKFLRDLGARVTRIEPAAGDPFYAHYPAYEVWHRGSARAAEAELPALLAKADVCITGGEDDPSLARRDAAALAAANPKLIVLNIEAYPAGTQAAGRPGVDVLIQARSGMAYEHFTARPIVMSFAPSQYGAALRGLCGVFAALYERESSGLGQIVSTSLYEGALSWLVSIWLDVDKPTPNTNFAPPIDPYPLIFRAADGAYVHIVIGGTNSKYLMYQALDIDDPTVLPGDSGMPKVTNGMKNFYGDIDVLAAHVAKQPSGPLLERIWALGLPAEPVLPPGACWDTPQIQHNGTIVEEPDGTRHVGMPFTLSFSPGAAPATPRTGARPLDGVRAIDFGAFVAGPFATSVLGDLGADVIKVETPAGDPNRGIFRSWAPCGHGKRAISIDLKQPEGLALARQICVSADIVTNNFRSGVSARLGIDPASLHAAKPGLVTLESPGYGSSGPLADRAAFDMSMQAVTGHEYRAGGTGNEPLWNRTSVVDYAGGFLGAISALACLYHRARTGEGASICSALFSAGIFMISELVQRPDGRFVGAEPLNASRTGYHPAEALYEAADGWIAVGVRGAAAGAAMARVLALELPAEPLDWGDAEAERIAAAVREHNAGELVAALEAAGAWAELCRRNAELETLHDPELRATNTVRTSLHPQFGEIRELGAMLRFSRSHAGAVGHPPLLGQHTRQVLAELGKSEAEIDALLEKKVVA